jgi:AcrR family transcriptional regulator
MKKDRRVQRTRELLREALLGLLIKKDYDAITVHDVLQRAKVARSSFYAHFRDKDDLLIGGFQDVIDSLPGDLFATPSADGSGFPDFGLWLFQHVEQNRVLARAILNTEVWNLFSGHLRNVLVVQTKEWVNRNLTPKDRPPSDDLVVHYLVGALLGLLTWWVSRDFPHTATEMSAAFKRLAVAGLAPSSAQRAR